MSSYCSLTETYRSRMICCACYVADTSYYFTAKGTSLRESTSVKRFCMKISWAVYPQVGWGKIKKSHRN